MTPDGNGENKLGELLMERRAELAALEAAGAAPKPTAAAAAVASEPATGAAEPSPAARKPSAKRQKVKHEPEVIE